MGKKTAADRAALRTILGMTVQTVGAAFVLIWLLMMLTAFMGLMVFRSVNADNLLTAAAVCVPLDIAFMAGYLAVGIKRGNAVNKCWRLYKEYGEGSNEVYEFTLAEFRRLSAAGERARTQAAEWAVRMAVVCIGSGRPEEAEYYLAEADMSEYLKHPGFAAYMQILICYHQVSVMIDIERNDPDSEERHYAAAEEYFREIKKGSGFYPYVTLTRCDHLLFRGETDRAAEILTEQLKYLEGSKDSNAVMETHFRLGMAYTAQGKTSEAKAQFDRVMEICPDASRNFFAWKIGRFLENSSAKGMAGGSKE